MLSKAFSVFVQMHRDCLREKQADGNTKWSWFRISGYLWFWIADVGSLAAYWWKGIAPFPMLGELTGIILLGVVGGKAVNGIDSAIKLATGNREVK